MAIVPLVTREVLERVLVFINGKGGVGKTTLVANMGALLGKSGYRVLLVDMDPQGNLGLDLGYAHTDADDDGRSLAAALLFGQDANVVASVREGVDVIVGGDALHHASAALAAGGRGVDPRDALARILAPLAPDYDLILVDCPPGNESLQNAAIAAGRWLVVPAKTDSATARGMEQVAKRLASVKDINPAVDLLGVPLFDIDTSATRVQERTRQMIEDVLGTREVLFDKTIRHSAVMAQDARSKHALAHELEEFANSAPQWWQIRRGDATQGPDTGASARTAKNVADDFHQLTIELVERLTAREGEEVPA